MNTVDDLNKINDFLLDEPQEEYTFVALKPNATDLIAAQVVIQILAENNFEVAYCRPVRYDAYRVMLHYKEIYDNYCDDPTGKFKFYPELEAYLTSGPIFGMIIKGENAVAEVKKLCGATSNPAPGTMRHELFRVLNKPYDSSMNGIHASGKVDEAKREIDNFINAYLETLKTNDEATKRLYPLEKFVEGYQSAETTNFD